MMSSPVLPSPIVRFPSIRVAFLTFGCNILPRIKRHIAHTCASAATRILSIGSIAQRERTNKKTDRDLREKEVVMRLSHNDIKF